MKNQLMWNAILIFSCVTVLSLTTCVMHKDYQVGQAIKAGASPLEAGVAFSSQRTAAQVAILEMKKCKPTNRKD